MHKLKCSFDITKEDLKTTRPFFNRKSWRWLRSVEYFIRVRIFKQKRYLIDSWACEMADVIREEIDKEIIESLRKQLKKENDE